MHKKPNFANYLLKVEDVGKDEIVVSKLKVKLPYTVKRKDIGKRVAVNLNGRMR